MTGGMGLFLGRRAIAGLMFPLGAAIGIAVGLLGFASLGVAPQQAILPIGLPTLPFHLRLDSLSAVFVMLLGFAGAGISIYAAGYFGKSEVPAFGALCRVGRPAGKLQALAGKCR